MLRSAVASGKLPELPGYQITERIGRGRMGAVFGAVRVGPAGFRRRVAIKRLSMKLGVRPELVERFLREARISAALDHPNVVRVHDLLEVGDDFFMVMELLRGLDLRQALQKGTPPFGVAVSIAQQVLAGLAHAHDLKDENGKLVDLVHRDLTPRNVFLCRTGNVKVLDFGVAHLHQSATDLTQPGQVIGSLLYLAPEVQMGQAPDVRSDIYQVGLLLYLMLTGERPVVRRTGIQAPRLATIDASVRDVVACALEMEPSRRFKSAEEMSEALQRPVDNTQVSRGSVARWLVLIEGRRASSPRFLSVSLTDSRSNARVVTLASRRVVFGGTPETGPLRVRPGWVQFDGGAIAAVGEDESPAGSINFGERLITPAFINPHTHCALQALRGLGTTAASGNVVEDLFYRVEAKMSPDDIAAFARVGAYESLLSGVGLVWDHYFCGDAVARAFAEVGLSAVVAPTLQDRGGPRPDQWERQLAATESIARNGRLANRGIVAAVGPHATDTVSANLWREVIKLAQSESIPVHAHLAQSVEEVERAREWHDMSPVEWLHSLGVLDAVQGVFAHGLFVNRSELRSLGHAHTLVSCPYSQMVFGFPARVDVWSEERVRWTVATDCAASNDSMSLRKELRFLAGQRTVPTSWSNPYEHFLNGTGTAADVWRDRQARFQRVDPIAHAASLLQRVWGVAGSLHPSLRAGVLEPGALANVVIWDVMDPSFWPALDPLAALAFADVDGAIHAMYVAGEPVGTAGDFRRSLLSSQAYQAHLSDAAERLGRLIERAGL